MKNINFYRLLFLFASIILINGNSLNAQDFGEFEGTVDVSFNGTFGQPQLRLLEDQTASTASTRLAFLQTGSSDQFEIRSFLSSSNQRIGFSYNNFMRVVWNENTNGFGIGTQSPTEKLEVEVTGNDGIRIDGNNTGDARLSINNNNGTHYLFDDTSNGNTFKLESANDLAFNTGGTSERMRILTTGEVGINTDPVVGNQLNLLATSQTQGIESLNNSSGNATSIRGRVTSGTGARYGMLGWVLGSDTGDAYGVYGVAETGPSNSWALYANGDFWYAGSLKAPSDIRLKQNIEDLPSVLDKVLKLETKTYEYNQNVHRGLNLASGTQIGFIAQDVQKHFPSLVEEETHSVPVENETGETVYEQASILGLSSMEMIPILTKAIQEQHVLMKEQSVLIDELRQEVDLLKSEK